MHTVNSVISAMRKKLGKDTQIYIEYIKNIYIEYKSQDY